MWNFWFFFFKFFVKMKLNDNFLIYWYFPLKMYHHRVRCIQGFVSFTIIMNDIQMRKERFRFYFFFCRWHVTAMSLNCLIHCKLIKNSLEFNLVFEPWIDFVLKKSFWGGRKHVFSCFNSKPQNNLLTNIFCPVHFIYYIQQTDSCNESPFPI